MIDLDRATLNKIKRILYLHVPACQVWAFGSRVGKIKHHPNADLDLALECSDSQLPDWEQMEQLRQAFSESDIPILVDISLWEDLPPALQQHIRSHGEKIILRNNAREAGFTIVQAVFVLVVLGMLGAYMVTMSTVQQATSTQALMQARAYQAARAGLEWGIVKAPEGETGDSFVVDGTSCEVKVEIEIVETSDPNNYFTEGIDEFNIYHITANAAYPNLNIGAIENPDYVSRKLAVTIMVKADE
jgi:MSHA biogenesis protein MshP